MRTFFDILYDILFISLHILMIILCLFAIIVLVARTFDCSFISDTFNTVHSNNLYLKYYNYLF